MPKEFKFDNNTGKTLYRNHRSESFQPYTKEMEEYDKFMSKMVAEEDTLFTKSNTTSIVKETPTTEGDIDMQECCKFYDNLVPFSCRHRTIDKWDLLWQCSVCGSWYKIEFDTSNLTPRIKTIEEVDPRIYFDSIEHKRMDAMMLRNIQAGVPLLDPEREAVVDMYVTRKYDWMCPNCTYAPETILGDEGTTYRCRDCGTTYKLWTNQDTKAVSYIKLNAPKVEAPVVVSKPEVEDAPVQEETTVEEVTEVSESPNEIVEDTPVEETPVNEATEEITPTIVNGKVMAPSLIPDKGIVDYPNVIKPHSTGDPAQIEELYNHIKESSKDIVVTTVAEDELRKETDPEWSEDIIDEMMDTGELPEAFIAPCVEDIPDDNYLKEDKTPDTSAIQEEGILIARGIPDWMCDDCLEHYTDVTLVDFDNAPGHQCLTCGTIYYIERVGEEQDIVYKQFKQITPEEVTAMYVTTDSTSVAPVTEEKDIFSDKVVEALTSVELEEHPPIIDDAGEDIDPEDFVSIDDEDEGSSSELEDLSSIPDMTLDEVITYEEDDMEHDYHTQAIKEDMVHHSGVDTYHVHVNLPKGIQNIVVTDEQISKGPLGQMIREAKEKEDDLALDIDSDLNEMDDYNAFNALQKVSNDWNSLTGISANASVAEDFVEGFATVPNNLDINRLDYINDHKAQSEVHTLDFVVMDNRKNKGVRINKNESYSFEVESFSACMDSAGSGITDYPDDNIIVIKDELAGELGSWDSMIYELRLTTGEMYCVCIDLAMLNKVTISYK